MDKVTQIRTRLPLWSNAAHHAPLSATQIEVMAGVYKLVKAARAAYGNLLDEFHAIEKENGKSRHRETVAHCSHIQCRFHRERLEEIDSEVDQLEQVIGEIELPLTA